MAMFPLGTPLVPTALLPLQIFEPRFHLMLQDCLTNEASEFGVVLIERGSEVGGGDIRAMAGTAVRILNHEVLPDGRRLVIVQGMRRIRIHEWLPDDPYPQALVADWADDRQDVEFSELERSELVTGVLMQILQIAALLEQLEGVVMELPETLQAADFLAASYQLTAMAPIGPADRQKLLCADGPRVRLQQLQVALEDVEAVCRFRLQS